MKLIKSKTASSGCSSYLLTQSATATLVAVRFLTAATKRDKLTVLVIQDRTEKGWLIIWIFIFLAFLASLFLGRPFAFLFRCFSLLFDCSLFLSIRGCGSCCLSLSGLRALASRTSFSLLWRAYLIILVIFIIFYFLSGNLPTRKELRIIF